ncbi:anaerobic ribonucleoside-triphosphate reductase activating protein [Gammaproteobacteria bacterium]
MKLRLNKAHYPVTTLGPGRRIGLWTQGCRQRCRGCVSQDTWAEDADRLIDISVLLDWCRTVSGDALDGVTISGGEPFDQPEALAELLDGLHAWRIERDNPFDILCYSGLSLARLERDHAELLARLDVLIPEPFQEHRPRGGIWRGSDNQPLIPLSPLVQTRYAPYLTGTAEIGKRFQIAVDNEAIWCIGIPERGDMVALEAVCAERGLCLGMVSWRG